MIAPGAPLNTVSLLSLMLGSPSAVSATLQHRGETRFWNAPKKLQRARPSCRGFWCCCFVIVRRIHRASCSRRDERVPSDAGQLISNQETSGVSTVGEKFSEYSATASLGPLKRITQLSDSATTSRYNAYPHRNASSIAYLVPDASNQIKIKSIDQSRERTYPRGLFLAFPKK